jgi:hypothetical protein
MLSERLPAALQILDSLKGLLNQPYNETGIEENKAVITSLCESGEKDYAALLKVVSFLDRNCIRGKISRRKKSNEAAVEGILKTNAAFFDDAEKAQRLSVNMRHYSRRPPQNIAIMSWKS